MRKAHRKTLRTRSSIIFQAVGKMKTKWLSDIIANMFPVCFVRVGGKSNSVYFCTMFPVQCCVKRGTRAEGSYHARFPFLMIKLGSKCMSVSISYFPNVTCQTLAVVMHSFPFTRRKTFKARKAMLRSHLTGVWAADLTRTEWPRGAGSFGRPGGAAGQMQLEAKARRSAEREMRCSPEKVGTPSASAFHCP